MVMQQGTYSAFSPDKETQFVLTPQKVVARNPGWQDMADP